MSEKMTEDRQLELLADLEHRISTNTLSPHNVRADLDKIEGGRMTFSVQVDPTERSFSDANQLIDFVVSLGDGKHRGATGSRGQLRNEVRSLKGMLNIAVKTAQDQDALIERGIAEIKRMREAIELMIVEVEVFDDADTCTVIEAIQDGLREILNPDSGPQPEKLHLDDILDPVPITHGVPLNPDDAPRELPPLQVEAKKNQVGGKLEGIFDLEQLTDDQSGERSEMVERLTSDD